MTAENEQFGENVNQDESDQKISDGDADNELSAPPSWEETKPLNFTGKYILQGEFGNGAWSNVYRAITSRTPSTILATSPHTPPNSPPRFYPPTILAIKTPAFPSAKPVITHEARILSYLSAFHSSASYIVPFHGLVPTTTSLVLTAVPLTLEKHARSALHRACENFTTRTMFDPVIGSADWLSLATALVHGLAWLHARGCVHGDIKPANILLSSSSSTSNNDSPYHPLYCDFSSASIIVPNAPPRLANTVNDAITPTFTAPELLNNYSGGKLSGVATFSTDVFSLAATLVMAALGESPYQSARSEMQRLAMACEGQPLDFARGGDQGTRVQSGGLVSERVEGALRKYGEKRWTAEEWGEKIAA